MSKQSKNSNSDTLFRIYIEILWCCFGPDTKIFLIQLKKYSELILFGLLAGLVAFVTSSGHHLFQTGH
jgi:hypothetical protein